MERAGLTVPEGKRLRDLDESEREFGRENVLKRIEEIKATRLTTPRTSEERIEDFYKNFVDLMMVEDI
jgi:hypothetical protein